MPPEQTDLDGFAGAELTSCVLLRTAVPRDDAGSAVNGFSVLQFTAALEQEVGLPDDVLNFQ